jgi:hypothetical protein
VAGGLVVASVGWQWIFFINVPVGLAAVVTGWLLLPRTRQRADRQSADLPGMALLAVAAAGTLVVVSAVSGLGVPALGAAGFAVLAVLAGAGLRWRERGAAAPLIYLPLLAARGMAPLLSGALCAYLVLFGPLVLFPQVLIAHGGSVVLAGLMLTTLPTGFGLAAVVAGRILPARWSDRYRCLAGGLFASGCAAALAVPAPAAVTVIWLGLLGVGLGTYIPANNTVIMTAVPPQEAAAAGGMVNMARSLGTALGVALVTLALHAAARLGQAGAGPAAAMAALAFCALAAAWTARSAGTGRCHGTPRAGRRALAGVRR